MRYPKFLNENKSIAFVATSFGAATEPYTSRVKKAKRTFNKLGHNVIEGDSIYKSELPYLANLPEVLAKEFMDMYQNEEVGLLLSVGGGELQFETLEHLDFKLLNELEPKWFDGFSDNTNYSFLFPTLLDVASIYGHCAGSFGMYHWHQSILDDYNLFTGKNHKLDGYGKFQLKSSAYQRNHPLSGYNLKHDTIITPIGDCSHFEGRLLGGCLDILSLICGTKYDKVKEFNEKYNKDGVIWFLEACDLSPISIRRSLLQLKMAGWFDNAKGFLIGRSRNAFLNEEYGIDRINAISVLNDLNVPILIDVDLGHIPPTMPIVCGSYGIVNYEDNNFSLEMKLK